MVLGCDFFKVGLVRKIAIASDFPSSSIGGGPYRLFCYGCFRAICHNYRVVAPDAVNV
jgi:hypothetical protein